jgi:preprotein translocase subunit SecA
LSAFPVDGGKPNYERVIVGLLEMIPFDDVSKEAVKKQLAKSEDKDKIKELLVKVLNDVHKTREKQVGETVMRQIEKYAYLGSIDHLWINHIDHIDGLREAVTLRAYGQRDPLVEFKNEAYELFEGLIDRIDEELSRRIFRIGVAAPQPEIPLDQARTNVDRTDAMGLAQKGADETAKTGSKAFSGNESIKKKKIGRNDPCWCGSGKKWKKCHYPQLS